MNTREIERTMWNDYMASVSQLCQNRPVTIEVSSGDLGDQTVVDHQPFLGISPELKGSEACAVDIEVGKPGSTDAFMHEVPMATRVMVQEDDDGTPKTLNIEGQDPTTNARIKTIITWD